MERLYPEQVQAALEAYMAGRGVTQVELSKTISVSQSTISRVLNSSASQAAMRKVVTRLGLTPMATTTRLQEIVRRLDLWWELGIYATSASRELNWAIRGFLGEDSPEEVLEEFPPDLRADIESLLVNPPTEEVRKATAAFLADLDQCEAYLAELKEP